MKTHLNISYSITKAANEPSQNPDKLDKLNDEITTRLQHLTGCLAVLSCALSRTNEDNAPPDFSYSVHSTVELASALADGLFSPIDELHTIAENASTLIEMEVN